MNLIPSVWLLSVVVNLFFLYAVFETKFQSPVVQVHKSHKGQESSGIKRVVFFVADGLRADSFFDHPNLHPYLTNIMEEGLSKWGISDTRVPTESRPGHIALFAGFYEDPSAIFTGWKDNLVEFDTVFNQSDFVVAFGSPDVINMFSKGFYCIEAGIGSKRFYSETYPSDWQDFLQSNSSKLDIWVFDKFKSLIASEKIPRNNKLLIFLHLLGIDNTGHATKPKSHEYLANIALVDGIVSEVQVLVEKFFGDKDTLFVFTSDHGMTDWGSHGDGSTAETETPFVVWGRGIKGDFESDRLKQADFASLLSGALCIPFPTNSVGRFPSNFWKNNLLGFDALHTNLRQLNELMLVKKSHVAKRSFPYSLHPEENEIEGLVEEAVKLYTHQHYDLAIDRLNEGLRITSDATKYYERYDQTLLTSLTVASFIIWIVLIGSYVVQLKSKERYTFLHPTYLALAVFFSVVFTKGALGWSLWRVPYTLFPLYLCRILYSLERNRGWLYIDIKVLLGLALCVGILSEILVLSFYRREILTLGLFLNALWCMRKKRLSTWQGILWIWSVAVLGIFPIMPVIGKDQNSVFMSLGVLTSLALVVLVLTMKKGLVALPKWDRMILSLQVGLLFAVSVLIHFPEAVLTRVLAWFSIALSFCAPVFVSSAISLRILSIFLGVATPFSFLSLTYESFFLPSLFAVLIHLLKLEIMEDGDSWEEFFELRIGLKQRFTVPAGGIDLIRSFRLAGLHLFFVFFSFFGIGNIGSVSSFDPSAVRCFLSVFNPFVMMLMLLQKIMAPFLLVASIFRLLLLSRAEVERNFLIVLLLSQCMGLHMFLNVTNEGSWLDIGTSISHFVIVQSTTFFILLLYILANFLTSEHHSLYKNKFPLLIVQQKQK